ncbi:hypothetical protein J5J10_12585 [Ciceribacter sp. L1K23]|uniref:hypothetical protein n=1 Tax=Ciceribacter sp. L1K23 TaxID=2820276 RepID=UPI001B825F66|nr:hypothetical protein [Ciceribacter sp. L1K23]MBR0556516.1 hypothetical protein [Ciceribacter sp. L1K23]
MTWFRRLVRVGRDLLASKDGRDQLRLIRARANDHLLRDACVDRDPKTNGALSFRERLEPRHPAL